MLVSLASLSLAALAAPPLEEATALVAVHLSRDGVRLPAEELARRTREACAQGSRALCALAELPPTDRLGAYGALSLLCEDPDPLACLGAAWALLPLSGSSVDESRPAQPSVYRRQLERACEGGVARACTELGSLFEHGIATYQSRPRALQRWLEGCAQDQAHACTAAGHALESDPRPFVRALSLGDPTAGLDLARLRPEQAEAHLSQACSAGVTAACFESASQLAQTEPTRALPPLQNACALGDPPACALALKLEALAAVRPQQEVMDDLRALCPTVVGACEDLAFLDHGAPLTLHYPGHTPHGAKDLERGLFDLARPLHECTRAAAGRLRSAQGSFHASFRIEADGRVSAAYVHDALDMHQRLCLEQTLRGGRFRAPEGGVQRAEAVLPGYHGARVELTPPEGVEVHHEVTDVATDALQWAVPLDACFLAHALPTPDSAMEVRFLATRAGALEQVELLRSSEHAEVDACVLDWLSQRRVGTPPAMPMRLTADIAFVTPWPTDPRTSQAGRTRLPPDGPRPQTAVKVLVIAVEQGLVSGKKAKLGARSFESIRQVHTDLAAWVAEHTHGALTFDWELVTVPGPLQGALLDGEGFTRWNVSPSDLTPEIRELVAARQVDSVFLYSPVPRGFPQPWLGVAWNAQISGATFASLALQSGREVQSNPGTPTLHLPLHEWWHQMEYRSEKLGVSVPKNHEILRLDGVALNPRDWLDSTNTMEWYDEVLGYQIHPELWRDAWTREPWNLLYFTRHQALLSDGVTSGGGFELGRPVLDGLELSWPQGMTIQRVVLHVVPREQPSSLSLSSGGQEQRVQLGAGQSVLEVTLQPGARRDLQIVALDEASQELVLTELGVYPW